MDSRFLCLILIISLTGIFGVEDADGALTARPLGVSVAIEGEDTLEETVVLTNEGQQAVDYKIKLTEPRDERNLGPRRDDLGDIIAQFQRPNGPGNGYCGGIAWDWNNQVMWLTELETANPARIMAIDPEQDYRVVAQANTPGQMMDAAWCNGVLYCVNWSNNWLFRFDGEGRNLGNLNFQFRPTAVGASQENNWLFVMDDAGEKDILVFDIEADFEQIGRINTYHQFTNNELSRSVLWVDKHPSGQLWMATAPAGGAGQDVYQLHVDTDNWRVTEQVQHFHPWGANIGGMGCWGGLGHDGHNLWSHQRNEQTIRVLDDNVTELYWMVVEPLNGSIEGGEEAEVLLTFRSIGIEAGTYEFLMQIYPAGQLEPDVQMSVVMTVDDPTVSIEGVVSDARTGEPIEGVCIRMDRFAYVRQTDENGFYELENLPLGEYRLSFSAPNYLDYLENFQFDEGGNIDGDIGLLHSTCVPDVEELFAQLEPGDELDLQFNVTNTGNGPLTYRTERRLLGDANAEPWTIRRSYNSGQVLNDDRLEGAVFDGERFYVCGAAGNEPNTIYVLNREGELVDQFDQPGESVYGMKDLEWDGELIWGSGERRVFGFTTEGEVAVEFQGPYNPNTVVAYDSRNDIIWVAATTNDIVAYDREGNRIQRTLSRKGFRLYGLAYWPDDPDGYPLYVFHSPEANIVRVHKMNPENNGDTLFVRQLYADGGVAPGGASITNQYDVYSWVMVAIANIPRNNGNDRIDIVQVDARKDWFRVEPASGVINAGEEQEFTLHLNATGLPTVTFEGELAFYHDGVGSLTRIPVTLDVVEGRVNTFRDISLARGWNLVSTNLQPEDEDVTVITRPLVNAGQLQLMKNGFGQFYAPAVGFNNIPGWFAPQGYWMKLTEAAVLRVAGESVLADDPIELARGWNLISYYPRRPVAVETALAGIVDHLLIAKDGFGSFYVPAWGFNNMAPMAEGRGYQLKVDEDIELVYRTGQVQSVTVLNNVEVTKFNRANNTGNNMSLLLLTDKSMEGFVKVFAGSRQVGLGYAKDGFCGIAIWGDDPATDEIDGAVEGEMLTISNFNRDVKYITDGFEAIEVKAGLETRPTRFELISVYPNPFNSTTRISYNIPNNSKVSICLYDISGRIVATLVNSEQVAGSYNHILNADGLSAGIYFVRMDAGAFSAVQKVVLVK